MAGCNTLTLALSRKERGKRPIFSHREWGKKEDPTVKGDAHRALR